MKATVYKNDIFLRIPNAYSMDTLTSELITAAACGCVEALSKDGFEKLQSWVRKLWARESPSKQQAILTQLEASAQQLTQAPQAKRDAVKREIKTKWTARFEDLIGEHPESLSELKFFEQEFRASHDRSSTKGTGDIHVETVGNHSIINTGTISNNNF